MPRLPADEDYARALLSIFEARKIRARQSLRLSEAQAAFLQADLGRVADFDAALKYALSLGWLALSLDFIRLTAPGADEMQTVGGFLQLADIPKRRSSALRSWIASLGSQ